MYKNLIWTYFEPIPRLQMWLPFLQDNMTNDCNRQIVTPVVGIEFTFNFMSPVWFDRAVLYFQEVARRLQWVIYATEHDQQLISALHKGTKK